MLEWSVNLVQDANPVTRQRLLEAAGETFAERGFRAATIRDICRRAGANVAAVNYHFGDKKRLYAAVLQYAHTCALQKHPPQPADNVGMSAEDRLRAFVRSFLSRLLDEGRPAWHGKLMAREMVEPTEAMGALVENSFRPQFELLISIIRGLLGNGPNPEKEHLCARSIVGQCIFYRHGRAVIDRLDPAQRYGTEEVRQLADHVTDFSLAALKQMAAERKDGPR
jgi:AcrR family transcriptional regulator